MKNVKRTQGFTLIELLIVIAIIGILAAVLIPNLLGAQKRAYDTGVAACAKSIQTAEASAQIDGQLYLAIATGTGKINGAFDGVSAGCLNTNIQFKATTGVTPSASNYSFDMWDTRGSKTYTVTPSNLASVPFAAGVAPTGGAVIPAN